MNDPQVVARRYHNGKHTDFEVIGPVAESLLALVDGGLNGAAVPKAHVLELEKRFGVSIFWIAEPSGQNWHVRTVLESSVESIRIDGRLSGART